jgi:ethanolamine utilization cobalamin adenosyltransferase
MGGIMSDKPEYLTQLAGDALVCKDNARIRLRGEVDLLMAELLKTQLRLKALGCQRLVDDLEEVGSFIKGLSRAEVLDKPFVASDIAGLDYREVRTISHNPKRHFGCDHLFELSYQDGEPSILLNALRARSRCCELAFYEAFKTEAGPTARPDLMEGYNRLSSILYIFCLRAKTGYYEMPRV